MKEKTTKYFYDTEFVEDGKTIDLISIAIVSDDGREFYAQNLECDFERAGDWVKENVFPSLTTFDLVTLQPVVKPEEEDGYGDWYNRASIACALRELFIKKETEPEFWGYYSAYDHVALCQLFGPMINLPRDWPMYTRDLKQWCDMLGNPKLPEQGKGEHNALADAKWNRQAYYFLESYEREHAREAWLESKL